MLDRIRTSLRQVRYIPPCQILSKGKCRVIERRIERFAESSSPFLTAGLKPVQNGKIPLTSFLTAHAAGYPSRSVKRRYNRLVNDGSKTTQHFKFINALKSSQLPEL